MYEEVEQEWSGALSSLGFTSMNSYLEKCEDYGICLQGSIHVKTDVSLPDKLEYSPHVLPQEADNLRCYVGTNAARRLMGHRTKSDRQHWYGNARAYGKRACMFLIEGRWKELMNRVGLSHNSTGDLASSILPIPVHIIYEVTWKSLGVHDAIFNKVYDEYE